ncbi:MAG: adenine-specific methyltransferase EcoRI family protein, partial [Coriobacteriia bacterium]|nr:adenine-specific methyltransferase EcoRI family protein [Coriobacteriia bacterium]
MTDNASLGAAKTAKNDEFYTRYSDIEAEMNAYVEYNPDVFRDKTILLPCDDPEWSNFTKYFASNFERFGLKKLISTSYAKGAGNRQLTLFEAESPLYDEEKHETRGKLFVLTHDADGSGNIDTDDIEFTGYLEGDGDFRSAEICELRDEADIIVTNPPFSLFQDFIKWIMDAGKQFIVIGNQNSVSHKDIFPLFMQNLIWLGAPFSNGDAYFD